MSSEGLMGRNYTAVYMSSDCRLLVPHNLLYVRTCTHWRCFIERGDALRFFPVNAHTVSKCNVLKLELVEVQSTVMG